MRLPNQLNSINFVLGVAIAYTLLLPLTLWSQDSTQKTSSKHVEQALEQVTVTARKWVEGLQKVALSVSAMSQQKIEGNFATALRDLVNISPNTVLDDISEGPGGVAATYICDIGVSKVERNFDPAAGVVVDGVFRASASGCIGRALDLERIELLRGPQGTLFGRNTIGGVIIMKRTRPRNELSGKLRAGYGNYDTTTLDGVVNIPLADTLALKLTGTLRDQNEGFFDNLNTGRDEDRVEYSSFTINPLWTPTENLEIEWTYVRERSDQGTPPLLNASQPGQLFCAAFGWCSPNLSTPVAGDRCDVLTAYRSEATTIWPGPFEGRRHHGGLLGPGSGWHSTAALNQREEAA